MYIIFQLTQKAQSLNQCNIFTLSLRCLNFRPKRSRVSSDTCFCVFSQLFAWVASHSLVAQVEKS